MSAETHSQSLGSTLSVEIVENLKEFFPENDDLTYEELLRQQECVYQSFQLNSNSRSRTPDPGQSSDRSEVSGQEGESSRRRSVESQLALDEALARSLQELGDDLDDCRISEIFGHAGGSSEGTPVSSRGTPVRAASPEERQDDVDVDDMTYEQLQSLGESVGTESKGLSEEFISRLPYFKYKSGLLSKKKIKEECVICIEKCRHGDYITTLPCAHRYHSECIKQWLKLDKTCPVCKEEVRDS